VSYIPGSMDEDFPPTSEPRPAPVGAGAGPEGKPPTSGAAQENRSGGAGASEGGSPPPEVRPPTAEDARDIVALVRRVPELDANSPYAYLLLCAHFGETGLVWREQGRLRAFVLGYQPPGRSDTYFLWQVGVDPDDRGRGLARRSVTALLARLEARGVRFLEATVTPSNEASAALFRGVARRLEAPCEERTLFGPELFPPGDAHEAEVLFRIGPWSVSPSRNPS
jgi:L-2,4-diaminobutyric acid acetyltransferase